MLHKLTTDERFDAIFGPPPLEERDTGRSRRCKTCGDWHLLSKPWPHNCRKPADTPPQLLPAPQIAPHFDAFVTGPLEGAEVINSRNEKREYMKKNGLVEYEKGVSQNESWAESLEAERQVVADIRRFADTDTDYIPPDLKAQDMNEAGSLDQGTEIETTDMEIAE